MALNNPLMNNIKQTVHERTQKSHKIPNKQAGMLANKKLFLNVSEEIYRVPLQNIGTIRTPTGMI